MHTKGYLIPIKTNRETSLYKEDNGEFESGKASWHSLNLQFYDLYIVNKDQIKEGDYALVGSSEKFIAQCPNDLQGQYWKELNAMKIVACTTPLSLNMPIIGEDFLESYVTICGHIFEINVNLDSTYADIDLDFEVQQFVTIPTNKDSQLVTSYTQSIEGELIFSDTKLSKCTLYNPKTLLLISRKIQSEDDWVLFFTDKVHEISQVKNVINKETGSLFKIIGTSDSDLAKNNDNIFYLDSYYMKQYTLDYTR